MKERRKFSLKLMKKSKLDWSNVELQIQSQQFLSIFSLTSLSKIKLMKIYQKLDSKRKYNSIYKQRRKRQLPRSLPETRARGKMGTEPSAGCLGSTRARGIRGPRPRVDDPRPRQDPLLPKADQGAAVSLSGEASPFCPQPRRDRGATAASSCQLLAVLSIISPRPRLDDPRPRPGEFP